MASRPIAVMSSANVEPWLVRHVGVLASVAFIALAAGLLVLAIAWRIPMMLWDHLDLVPIYEAWRGGDADPGAIWQVRAGHLHVAAYFVLLWTTMLSHGKPWLDCFVSTVLLIAYAAIVVRTALRTLPRNTGFGVTCLLFVIAFALDPGHLVNLQWGWQVAVFLCLAGVALAIELLAAPRWSWPAVVLACASSASALLSFSTALALVPVLLIAALLRVDQAPRFRLAIVVFAIAALAFSVWIAVSSAEPAPTVSVLAVARYTLNFIGAGIARYATDLAPWLALAGLVSAGLAYRRVWRRLESLPWLAFLLFGLFSAVLAALGRASAYGTEQAYATRYVSFSSVFWLGWLGLQSLAYAARPSGRVLRVASVSLVAVLALGNAVQMTRKALRVAVETRAVTARIRANWPNVDESLLRQIYFDQPDAARTRLASLHALGFAPFDE